MSKREGRYNESKFLKSRIRAGEKASQAHKPDEYIAIGQVARCEAFLKSLVNRLCEG